MKRGGSVYDFILTNKILSSAFKYIILNNSANHAPYHHFHHMMTVSKWVFIGSLEYSSTMTSKTFTSLMLAAMFHDMNHSMGELSDSENIKRALAAFRRWHLDNIDDEFIELKLVEDNIKATEYPYVIDVKDMTTSQKLMRDADLMVVLEPDWFQNIILGLMKEFKSNDVLKTIQGNIAFHKKVNMCTEWGKKQHKEHWGDLIGRLIDLETLFKD